MEPDSRRHERLRSIGTAFRAAVCTSCQFKAVANSTSLATFQSLDMTPDGRFITYLAYSNTGPGKVTSCVFVWDAMTETTTLVSVDLNGGVTTNSWRELPIIESSGRFISFLSTATNLTTNVIAPDVHLYSAIFNTTRPSRWMSARTAPGRPKAV